MKGSGMKRKREENPGNTKAETRGVGASLCVAPDPIQRASRHAEVPRAYHIPQPDNEKINVAAVFCLPPPPKKKGKKASTHRFPNFVGSPCKKSRKRKESSRKGVFGGEGGGRQVR